MAPNWAQQTKRSTPEEMGGSSYAIDYSTESHGEYQRWYQISLSLT